MYSKLNRYCSVHCTDLILYGVWRLHCLVRLLQLVREQEVNGRQRKRQGEGEVETRRMRILATRFCARHLLEHGLDARGRGEQRECSEQQPSSHEKQAGSEEHSIQLALLVVALERECLHLRARAHMQYSTALTERRTCLVSSARVRPSTGGKEERGCVLQELERRVQTNAIDVDVTELISLYSFRVQRLF